MAFAERWDAAIETGYLRIETALLLNACNLFSADELPPEEALRPMTVDQAIHILHMHKCEVRGIGRRPGLMARQRSLDEVRDSILRKIAAVERADEASLKALDDREARRVSAPGWPGRPRRPPW